MLNPRCFLEDCVRYNKLTFWRSGFPWAAIDSCIDNTSFDFIGTVQAQHLFTKQTGVAWDNLHDPAEVSIPCPRCRQQMTAPWTTSGISHWLATEGEAGDGFADCRFKGRCHSCQQTFDHDVLRASKFREDVEQLLSKNVPMPGTTLSIDGMMTSTI